MVVVLVVMMEEEQVLDEVKVVVWWCGEGGGQKYFRWGSNPCLLNLVWCWWRRSGSKVRSSTCHIAENMTLFFALEVSRRCFETPWR